MPIYEFTCTSCQHLFEELVLGRSEKVVCPKCSSSKVKKAMSVFSFSSSGNYRSSAASGCSGCSKGSCSGCGGN